MRYIVHYEPEPEGSFLRSGAQSAFKDLEQGRYASKGYARQAWSTFHSDRYTDADIIGIVDTDSNFTPTGALTCTLFIFQNVFTKFFRKVVAGGLPRGARTPSVNRVRC